MPDLSPVRAFVGAIVAPLMLAACTGGDDSAISIVAIGTREAPFESGNRLSATGQIVRSATTEGLVSFDAQGRVVPALADRWIVTDDGRSYIFRLRDGTWPGGSQIDSASAGAALRQAIAGIRGTSLALDLSGIEDIRIMAGRVIEIRLSRPMPDLLQLLAQPELGLFWRGRGTGPMRLRRDGKAVLLAPIPPAQRGLPAIADWEQRVRTVRFASLDASAAVEKFNDGEADVLLGGRIEHFPLASAFGISRGTVRLDPVSGLFGLAVVRGEGLLAAPENREALAMAIDRNRLIDAFGVGGWTASNRIVAPGSEGDLGTIGERWSGQSIDQRRIQAAARVSRWRAANGAPPRLSIALPSGPGADLLFKRISEDFSAIGVETRRVGETAPADLRLVDTVARYSRANWYLNQLSCAARRGLCSDSADARAAEARSAPDEASRAALLAEAEAELTVANVFIPFGSPIRWSLVRGSVTGFAPNRWGIHPLMPMAERPK
jgi:ABC-type transport system substrate-binding protein